MNRLFLLVVVLLVGCSDPGETHAEPLGEGVYVVRDPAHRVICYVFASVNRAGSAISCIKD